MVSTLSKEKWTFVMVLITQVFGQKHVSKVGLYFCPI